MRKNRVHFAGRSNAWNFKLGRSDFNSPLHESKLSYADSKLGRKAIDLSSSAPDPRLSQAAYYKQHRRHLWAFCPVFHKQSSTEVNKKALPFNVSSRSLQEPYKVWGRASPQHPSKSFEEPSTRKSSHFRHESRSPSLQDKFKTFLGQQKDRILPRFILSDPCKTGKVSYKSFAQIIDDLHNPYHTITSKHIEHLYAELGGNEEGINYREMIDVLAQFKEHETTDSVKTNINNINKRSISLSPLKTETSFNKSRNLRGFIKQNVKREEFEETLEKEGLEGIEKLLNSTISQGNSLFFKSELVSLLKIGETAPNRLTDLVYLPPHEAKELFYEKTPALPPLKKNPEVPMDNAMISKILEKIHLKGDIRTVFKTLDMDKDGYITDTDIQKAGLPLQFLNYLDSDKKGYATFKDFQEKLTEKIPSSLSMGTDPLTNSKSSLDRTNSFYNDLRERYKPPYNYITLEPSSRYGFTPLPPDTFSNMVPQKDSSLYLDDRDRHICKNKNPVSLAHEDKTKKQNVSRSKISYLKTIRKEVSDKALSAYHHDLVLEEQRYKSKHDQYQDYMEVIFT